MRDFGKLAGPWPIRADIVGAVSVEYALIAATIVFAIAAGLEVIGNETSFGLRPAIAALQGVLS